jgi:BirA family biotin operon repressor/biotin-[acetyl-CoA-carboxylase] ligase
VTPAPFFWHESVASTQDEAHRLAASGATHGTAVAGRIQTGGRGTRGRAWVSGEGGLWLSVVCRPGPGTATEIVGLRVGLALADLLDRLLSPPNCITLKWPNDLILGEKKLGGILAEARWQGELLAWMVIGVGLNLRNEIPPELSGSAARLADAGVSVDARALAAPVAQAVAEAGREATPLSAGEVAAFESRDWLRGRAISLPEPGVAEGITASGRLRVRSAAGTVTEVMAPVQLAGPA